MGEVKFPIEKIDQVCVVVRDLQRAMEHYWTTLGIGPWRVYTFGAPPMREFTYRGRPANYRMRIGMATKAGLVFELIQPLEGPSIYHEFLDRNGEGIHHFGLFIPNLDDAIAQAKEAGYAVIQSGRGTGMSGEGGFAYLSTEDDLSAIFELIELPKDRRPHDRIYPEA